MKQSSRAGSGGIACYIERRIKIIYLISSSKNRIHNLSRLQSHACAPAPQLASSNFQTQKNYICCYYPLLFKKANKNELIKPKSISVSRSIEKVLANCTEVDIQRLTGQVEQPAI